MDLFTAKLLYVFVLFNSANYLAKAVLMKKLLEPRDVENRIEYCAKYLDNKSKQCLYQSSMAPLYLWNHYSGMRCYTYTNPFRLTQFIPPTLEYFHCSEGNKNYSLYVLNILDHPPAFFDYNDSASLKILRKLFKTEEYFQIYLTCCREAEDCCFNQMNEENIKESSTSCPVIWDTWTCFPRTEVNTVAVKRCTSQAYSSTSPVCRLNSEKKCFFDSSTSLAKWNQTTNYDNCPIAPVYRKRHKFNVITLYVSIALSVPAVLIFLGFRKLRTTTRVILHRNLLIAIIIRSILTIMTKELIILDELKSDSKNIMISNTVACRVLTVFESIFKNSIYACMMVDGFYLHKMLARSFAPEPRLRDLYIIVIVLSAVPSLIWATVRGIKHRGSCWLVDTNSEQWIVDSFRVAVLTINIIFLLDIIRVMLTKFQQGNTSKQAKVAFKATIFLIPLFGVHIIVTADKNMVYDDSCLAEDLYDYARYSMEALQGIMVAILFCYTNSEVISEIRNGYRKLNMRFGDNTRYGKDRRITTQTFVEARIDND